MIVNQKIVSTFKKQSWKQLSELRVDDVEFFSHEEVSEFYTIVAMPDAKSLDLISEWQDELQAIDTDQYYYPLDTLHLTLIGNLPTTIDERVLIETAEWAYSNLETFQLRGVGSNQFCSSVSAYPNFELHSFRQELRRRVGAAGDDFSEHLATYEAMGWINYLRYQTPPPAALLQHMRDNFQREFGTMIPQAVHVYRSNKHVLEDATRLFSTS